MFIVFLPFFGVLFFHLHYLMENDKDIANRNLKKIAAYRLRWWKAGVNLA
jgi:hypothetical protein